MFSFIFLNTKLVQYKKTIYINCTSFMTHFSSLRPLEVNNEAILYQILPQVFYFHIYTTQVLEGYQYPHKFERVLSRGFL